jgi:TolB-like protein
VPPPQTSSSFTRWVVVAALAGVIALIGLFGWRAVPATATSGTPAGAHASPPAEVRVAVLPFAFFSTDPAIAMLAARLTDGVTTELARLGTLSVVSRTSAAQFVSEQRPVSEVASILGADYVMEGSAVVEQGQLKVTARLVDGARDRKVWVGEYQSRPEEVDQLEARIAAEAGPAALKLAPTPR